ncbi:MAG: hypothetical protein ACREIC_11775, partial [Limisphaerales bacterium]
MLVAILGQIVAFWRHADTGQSASALAKLPARFPPGYTAAENVRAQALDQAMFWGDLATSVTTALALGALLISRLPNWVGARTGPGLRAWLVRITFLVALFLCLKLVGMPYLYSRFRYGHALGLNSLTDNEWLRLVLVGMAVPLTLFVLKYTMLICMLPLARRFWWLAAALGFFLVGLAPELISRTYPLDPIE